MSRFSLLEPDRRAAHLIVDVGVQFDKLLLQRLVQAGDALAHPSLAGAPRSLALGRQHLHDLAAARHQCGEPSRHRVRQRPQRRLRRFRKARNHQRVDGIALGALAKRLRKRSHLRRIDHRHRQSGSRQARRHHRLKAAGRFDRHRARRQRPQPLRQLSDPRSRARYRKPLLARPHMHVQPILRHINSDIDRVHLIPSLRNRASQAAQATVRVRWNGGRRPSLIHGLDVP